MTGIPAPLALDREALARDIRSLPSLPTVVQELMRLLRQEVPIEVISNTLRLDQALSIKVLQLANSPLYGLSGRIGSVRDAINVLGLRQLGGLVIAAALAMHFNKLHGQSLPMNTLWRHSIGCAVASRHLALLAGLDSAAAFTAGLLHDVGFMALPDSILSTPVAKLSAPDMALYQRHPVLGGQSFMALDDHQAVAALIRSHHERFDGTGFPEQLKAPTSSWAHASWPWWTPTMT